METWPEGGTRLLYPCRNSGSSHRDELYFIDLNPERKSLLCALQSWKKNNLQTEEMGIAQTHGNESSVKI